MQYGGKRIIRSCSRRTEVSIHFDIETPGMCVYVYIEEVNDTQLQECQIDSHDSFQVSTLPAYYLYKVRMKAKAVAVSSLQRISPTRMLQNRMLALIELGHTHLPSCMHKGPRPPILIQHTLIPLPAELQFTCWLMHKSNWKWNLLCQRKHNRWWLWKIKGACLHVASCMQKHFFSMCVSTS